MVTFFVSYCVDEKYRSCLGDDTYIFLGNGTSIVKGILTRNTRFNGKPVIEAELRPLGFEINNADCTLFYSVGSRDANVHIGKIYKVNLININNSTTLHSELGYPVQIAVNWLTQKLYWCDSTLSTIEYSDFNGYNREILLENATKIQSIALDPCENVIYWISNGDIHRMKLDGTNRQLIVSNSSQSPNSLVIDFVSSRLYWAGFNGISSSDLEGSNISIVYNTKSRRPTAISLYHNTLYWAEWMFRRITAYVTNGTNVTILVDNVIETAAIRILDTSHQLKCCE